MLVKALRDQDVQRGILIRGEEDIWKRKRRDSYPQTIWAWAYSLAPGAPNVVVPVPRAVDVLREAISVTPRV